MRITIATVGRLKAGAESELAARYAERARLAGRAQAIEVAVREIPESRAGRPEDRRRAEAAALAAAIPTDAPTVALDERGRSLDSDGLADWIRRARDGGARDLVFLIGGPDGLDPALREGAGLRLAFGAATWPHQLVRAMLAEQLYRAVTILAGHPYHRGG